VTTDYSTEISAANNILHYSTVQYSTVQTLDHLLTDVAAVDIGMLPPEQYFNFITDTVLLAISACKPSSIAILQY
jgi:hypothetical protein